MRTQFCELVGVDLPIVLAPFGPWDQVELAAAVCGAGGLGSVGTAIRSPAELREQWARLRGRRGRAVAVEPDEVYRRQGGALRRSERPSDRQAHAERGTSRSSAVRSGVYVGP